MPLLVPPPFFFFFAQEARCLRPFSASVDHFRTLMAPVIQAPHRSNILLINPGESNMWVVPEVALPHLKLLPEVQHLSLPSSTLSELWKTEKGTSLNSFTGVWGPSASFCSLLQILGIDYYKGHILPYFSSGRVWMCAGIPMNGLC